MWTNESFDTCLSSASTNQALGLVLERWHSVSSKAWSLGTPAQRCGEGTQSREHKPQSKTDNPSTSPPLPCPGTWQSLAHGHQEQTQVWCLCRELGARPPLEMQTWRHLSQSQKRQGRAARRWHRQAPRITPGSRQQLSPHYTHKPHCVSE